VSDLYLHVILLLPAFGASLRRCQRSQGDCDTTPQKLTFASWLRNDYTWLDPLTLQNRFLWFGWSKRWSWCLPAVFPIRIFTFLWYYRK
jgi:hypothetical protein